MNKKRIRLVVISAAAAVTLYALLGFLLLPYVVKRQLIAIFERDFGHHLTLGEVRFNPFTFKAELGDIDLRDPRGGPMFACRSFRFDFELASVWRRTWTFAAITADAPHVYVELHPDGRHNFSALLEAMRDPEPRPEQALPRLAIGRIAIGGGQLDLADPQAGEAARITLTPISFELMDLTTKPADGARYTLAARSTHGERIEWRGEVTLNPVGSKGHFALNDLKAATLERWLGNRIGLEHAAGNVDASFDYDAGFTAGALAFTVTNLTARLAGLALTDHAGGAPFIALDTLELTGGTFDLASRKFALERLAIGRPSVALRIDAQGTPNWSALILRSPPSLVMSGKPSVVSERARAGQPAQPPAASPVPATEQAAAPVAPAGKPVAANSPADEPSVDKPVAAKTSADEPTTEKPVATPAQSDAPAAAPSTPAQAPIAPAPASALPWSGRVTRLTIADASFSFQDTRPQSDAELSATGVRLETGIELNLSEGTSTLTLADIRTAASKLALRTNARQLDGAEATIAVASIAGKVAAGAVALDVQKPSIALGSLVVQDANLGVRTGTVRVTAETFHLTAPSDADQRAEVAAPALDASTIAARTANAGSDAVALAALSVRARSVAIAPAGAVSDVRIDGLGGALKALVVRDPANGSELARLEQAEISGASVSTAARSVVLEQVALTNARASAILESGEKSNWDALLAALGAGARSAPAASRASPEAAPWRAQAGSIEVRNSGVAFTDRRLDPALALELEQVNVRAREVSTDKAQPVQLAVDGRIKDGGQFGVAGQVNMHTLAADLKVQLAGLSLTPLQPYAARYARVQIVSALASADGRVRYGFAKAAGADLVFEGEVGLDKVIVEETEPAQPFLSVETLRAAQTRLTLGPDRLEIQDLRLDKLATRLLIAKDRSINIVKLLRSQAAAPAQAPAPGDATNKSAAPIPASGPVDSFAIVISRVRLDHSVLEFSDMSLTRPFQARMHELQGVITGISTATDTRARMELDARVDEFGSAQIRGSMNLFKPRVFTDMSLIFRNLEMTSLTPYAAKFAGYRVASGKLSVDLHYRIKNSQLVGDNRIVVDKLELGERVESASALNVPLDLAIALLKDSDGRIDIGLPVSGSLEDPQFSIGAIVWKAIGNLLTGIVTAPFRALASILGAGAGSDDLSVIKFDPGSARIAAPERIQLQKIADALAKRPSLKLTVNPTYAPQVDREALQSLAVRREVLQRAGVKLAPGESPGPLDYGSARIRSAIEAAFTDAFGLPAARDLRSEVAQRKPKSGVQPPATGPGDVSTGAGSSTTTTPDTGAKQAGAPASTAPTDAVAKSAANAPAIGDIRIAHAMVRRLIEARPVDDAALSALAQQRAEAVVEALRAGGKVDPARLGTASARALDGVTEGGVATNLELGVAK